MYRKSNFLFFSIFFIKVSLLSQIQLLNDEFSDSLSNINWHNINETEGWNIQQLEWYNINDSMPNKLQMAPNTASWFGAYRGPLIYKEVSGNFVFSTHVAIRGRNGTFPTSDFDFNLAGVMCRRPVNYPNGAYGVGGWQANDQNYIFLSIGGANDGDNRCDPSPNPCLAPHLEVKTTINGNSTLDIEDINASETELRFVRIGAVFIVMYKLPEATDWIVHRRFQRNDFPDTVQIGFVTYTDWDKVSSYTPEFHNSHTLNSSLNPDPSSGVPFTPDVIGDFDYARFDSVAIPNELAGRNFLDPNSVSNAEILSFLGYTSEVFCPTTLHIHSQIDSNAFVQVTANEVIIMDTTILTKSRVEVTAGNEILLQSGFLVNEGVSFLAGIASCSTNSLAQPVQELTINQQLSLERMPLQISVAPNPFSSSTNIQYHLSQPEMLSLAVYDLNGRVVQQLLKNQLQEARIYQLPLRLTQQQSGMYIVVLQTGQAVFYQKILLQD